jgi:hypothetical protein
VKAGNVDIGVDVRHHEHVSPIVSTVLVVSGAGMMIAGSRGKRTHVNCPPASFNNVLTGHGRLQVTQYIPSTLSLSLMPGEVAMKWTLRHLSHMMPMWTGMGGDYLWGDAVEKKRIIGKSVSIWNVGSRKPQPSLLATQATTRLTQRSSPQRRLFL